MKQRIAILLCAGIVAFGITACRSAETDTDISASVSQSQEENAAQKAEELAKQRAALTEQIKNGALAPVQSDASGAEGAAIAAQRAGEEAKKAKDAQEARIKEEEAKKAEEARKQEEAKNQNGKSGAGKSSASNGSSSGTGSTPAKGSYANAEKVYLDSSWQYADHAAITSGAAVMYTASDNRKNIVVGVNAGHGTSGGGKVKTLCHPDGSTKTTGGTTGAGATQAVAVSGGMTFSDGTGESAVTLRMAQILRDKLLDAGYDVLMVRDGSDVQLDNVARTVICNNVADCHISLHWDGDGLNYDKGCFYISVPDGIKGMEPVASHWKQHNALGSCLVDGLRNQGCKIKGNGSMAIDLTQTSYSTIPSVDIELGNGTSDHSDGTLSRQADGLVQGVRSYFGQ